MFKLESYVTPILLSYVDKYIKNLKPEDSQVSLWGGDAVFNNLDLRLDVLEQELQLPFTFVNGHIHELRIHVPWTKLGSEPIVITINTIECILKLKDAVDSNGSETNSNRSSNSAKQKYDIKRKSRRNEIEDIPPSYVQSLISRITNNISIVCNNLILKYVEGDIVLSLNVKAAQMCSANENWEKAFIDLTLPDLVLRKLIELQDLTVCLDRRNASGKIETYQDPLLYRCSLEGRLYLAYDSSTSKIASVSRINLLCDNLELSITDQQLPMFVRLLQLCVALYFGEIDLASTTESATDGNESSIQVEEDDLIEDNLDQSEESWGTWAWSFIPQLLPLEDEDDEERAKGPRGPPPILHLGMYVNKASFAFKLSESADGMGVFTPQKFAFQTFGCLFLEGGYLDVVMRNPDCVNVQMGVSSLKLNTIGPCICPEHELTNAISGMNYSFITCGSFLSEKENSYEYFAASLFDNMAPENNGQRREYNFDWDDHFNEVTESKLMERSPTFVMDYFYHLELPEDNDKSSTLSISDLENSNLKERTLGRFLVGPILFNVTGAVIHRLQKFLHCAQDRDYEPYSQPKNELPDENIPTPSIDDINSLEEFIPFKTFFISIMQPVIKIYAADHPYCDVSKPFSGKKKNKKRRSSGHETSHSSPVLPITVFHANRLELQLSQAMYPKRLVKIASVMHPPSENLLHHCHSHLSIKIFGFEVNLDSTTKNVNGNINIFPPCSGAVYIKTLLLPEFWKNPFQPKSEITYEIPRLTVRATWPQLQLLLMLAKSWLSNPLRSNQFLEMSIMEDVFGIKSNHSLLEASITGIEWKTCYTDNLYAHIGWISAIGVYFQGWRGEQLFTTMLLHGPEDTSHISSASFFNEPVNNQTVDFLLATDRCLNIVIQFPNKKDSATAPSIFMINMKGITACLDPRLLDWMSYKPKRFPPLIQTPTLVHQEVSVKNENAEVQSKGSAPSSTPLTAPTDNQTQSKSYSAFFPLFGSQGETKIEETWVDYAVNLYAILSKLVLQVELELCTIFLPSCPVPNEQGPGNIVRSHHQVFAAGWLPDTLVVNLPRVSLRNGTQKHLLQSLLQDTHIPVINLDIWNAGGDLFPWSLSLSSFGCYSLHKSQEILYCFHPSSASATFALTTKNNLPASDKLTHLSLCIHADMEPLCLSICKRQVKLINDVTEILLGMVDHYHSLIKDLNSAVDSVVPPLFLVPSTITNKKQPLIQQVSLTSTSVIETVDNVSHQHYPNSDVKNAKGKDDGSSKSSDGKVKLSLWLQWTLPKLSINLMCSERTLINMEIEEMITSLDVQDIYCKVKLKISAVNCNYYQNSLTDPEWKPGPFEGIIFSCSDKLTKMVHMPNTKSDCHDSSSNWNYFDPHVSKPSESSHAFLSLTFTRAQCHNVQRRWAHILQDNISDLKVLDLHSPLQRYVSEIDIRILPFDCVLWSPILASAINLIDPLWLLATRFTQFSSSVPSSTSNETCLMAKFNNNTLPLLYVNAGTIRIFIPQGSAAQNPDEKKSKQLKSSPDMCILQVGSMYLTPQIDNPLSHIVLQRDIYAIAQQTRIISMPGSEVEDRQYQLDISGICFATGVWHNLVQCSACKVLPSVSSHLRTMGENPALEWNNKPLSVEDGNDESTEVVFLPLASMFNIRILIAPAIVYQQYSSVEEPPQDILVCGHSFEVNVTTDLDFYLGLHQMSLLYTIYQTNLTYILNLMNSVEENSKNKKERQFKNAFSTHNLESVRPDSGIESDISTLKTGQRLESTIIHGFSHVNLIENTHLETQKDLNLSTGEENKSSNFVPFEILLTAGSITFMIYTNEPYRSPSRVKEQPKKQASKKKKFKQHMDSNNKQQTDTQKTTVHYENEDLHNVSQFVKDRALKDFCQDGYEGSEENDDCEDEELLQVPTSFSDCGTVKECSNNKSIYPIVYFIFSQPHTFVRCHYSSQKVEMSCYNINMKGALDGFSFQETETKLLPSPEDYTVHWIETKPGEPNPKTGIPPALFTLTLTNFLVRPADLKIQVDRPLAVNVSITKYEQILDFIKVVQDVTIGNKTKETTDANLLPVEELNLSKSLENKIHHWRLLLSNLSSFHFTTVQLVLTVKTVPHKENSQIFLSLGQMTGGINFIVGSTGIVEDIQMDAYLDRYGIKTSFCDKVLPLIGPSSTNFLINAVWENWNAVAPFPQLCVNIETEAFFVNFGRDHLACLEIIHNHFQTLLELSEAQNDASNNSQFITEKDKTFNKFHFSQEAGQSWLDDLRVGTFQYIQDSDDNGLQPGPNEIVFCREQATQPASMTWCYEQPRVLTKAEIYPVPFRAASESSNVVSPEIQEEVSCVLQHWDPLMQSFITYQSFQLSETQHCILDLPQFDLEGNKEVIVAHKWRVVLNYCENEDELDEPLKKRSLVSPLALAACMRVDSYFHPCLIPNIQVRFAFNLIQVTLSNHLQHLGKAIPSQLQPFKFDSTIPATQDFLIINLENFILVGKQWFQKMKMDWKSTVHCKILEYRNLTMKTLIEPCSFHLQLYAMNDKIKPSVVEVTLIAESLFLHIGQTAVHTLNMAAQAWKQPAKKKEKQILMNYYTICNNTQETLRFGQVDLEESIILHSNEMHAYSWRSHKSKQLLHVCIVGMRWKWCEPFSIDKLGLQVRKMKQKGQKATLIIRVKPLNKIQKQVIISGQVVVSNRLNKNLEVRFVTCSSTLEDVSKSTEGANLEHTITVGKQTTAPSCIVNPEMLRNIYIRLKGTTSNWSHEIPISMEKNQEHQLVKLFLKEKDQFINVWCKVFIQQIESISQIMILLSPLYIVRTHLPCSLNLIITTPGLGQMHSVEVQGRGEEFQLNCPGEADLTHQLAFQLSHGMEISKPSLPLSTNMITQVTQLPALDYIDVEELCKGWASHHTLYWPYDDDDDSDEEGGIKEISSFRDHDKLQTKQGARKKSEGFSSEMIPHQPDIELKVCLVQRWPGCNTLLVDVKPWCLIINHSKVDLTLQSPDEKEWTILDGSTFAPPELEGLFKFGICYEDKIYYSEPFKMTNEDWTIRQNWPKVHGILPKEGHIQSSIIISTTQQQMICLFTIESKERHGIQVISIRPSYFVSNNTDCNLSLACCCVLNSIEKIEFLPHSSQSLHVPSYSDEDKSKSLLPVLFWELFQPNTSESIDILESEHAKYLTFAKGKGQVLEEWSLPFRLQMKPQQIRQAFTIPVNNDGSSSSSSLNTEAFIVTSHYYKGTVYLFIQKDPFPEMILYNNCDIPLYFGQTCMASSQEFTTQEESEMLYQLPVICQHTACHYTFPLTSVMFPELRDTQNYPKLHFARALIAKPDSEVDDTLNDLIYWSTGIDTTCALDQFLHIPDCGDIRIHMEHVGNTMHIYLDPVSRVEVSAKEIRSRIREQSWDILQNSNKLIPFPAKPKPSKPKTTVISSPNTPKNTASQGLKLTTSISQSEEESSTETEIPVLGSRRNLLPKKNVAEFRSQTSREIGIPSLIYISLTMKRASVVLIDEISDPAAVQEIMRTNISRIIMAVRPRVKSANKMRYIDSSLQIRQDIIICIEDLQIDNQMAQHGNYDFSVALVRQDFENKSFSSVSSKIVTDLMVQSARNDSLLVVEIVLENNFGYKDIPACLQEVSVNVKPLRILLEDKFLYHLVEIIPSFLPIASNFCISKVSEIPKVVSLAIANVISPIQFQKLTIKPVTLMLSLHASLKLFISLDNTPLVFKEFQRRGILTTSYKLGQALTMHYLSGALIRAGWVVGSLDLIGNPGGFARAIGSGVSDFVRLPYQGLIRSPWAFLIGVAHGSTSLIRQITAGTLMSITNLASSVSRNMERLALDEDYRIRNEEYRRNKPDSLTQGLTQGLTGFGISLLGAIAGIVDQPLQSLQLAVERPHPPVAAATGLISGVGKGLVGVVAKPLGGAAEFVSQAGQGILHGTGWSKILEPQYDSVIEQASNNTNSQLKYTWKMLPDLQVEVIIAVEATHVNQLGHYVPSILLLTSKVLFLVGIDEDTQQQAFSLSEIDCQGPMSDPTLIYLVPRQRQGSKSPQLEDQNQDRVAEFVNKTSKYAVRQANRVDGETESRSDSSTPSPVPSPIPTAMQLYVHPGLRNSFLAHFFSAQQCILGKGFNL